MLDLLKMNKDASDLEAVNPRSNNFEISLEYQALGARVHQTGGNRSDLTGYRSNRSGPVPV